ncbi:MAG: NAD(P)-dependent oxidoreductase [Deltaproteobacteria bacterium]
MTRAGFIGLGNIGRPMAARLVAAGFETHVYDLSSEALSGLASLGAHPASSAEELAAASDVIGICVRSDDEVRTVVTGPAGVLDGAVPGAVVAIHSTVLPATAVEMSEAAAANGVGLVDACVTGGAAGAEAGTLTYMVGGNDADIEKCRPVFESSASRIICTGGVGTGAAVKICNNVITYLEFLAAREAFRLAEAAGLSVDTLEEVTRSNGNLTEQMQAFLGLHKMPAEQRQEAGMRSLLEGFAGLADKDLASALELARGAGLRLPGTEACRGLVRDIYGLDD